MPTNILGLVLFVLLCLPFGCLLFGIERRVSARMQGRRGPVVLQPYYDVRKLLEKDRTREDPVQLLYAVVHLGMMIAAGAVFFGGGNFLICVFCENIASMFLVMAGFALRSPYAEAGSEREMVQVMSYEPMTLLVAISLYLVSGSFEVSDIAHGAYMPIVALPLIFCGLLFVLTIMLRKSPFDIAGAQHAHQEVVRGITVEMSGRVLALMEVADWVESVLVLGWVGLFFMSAAPLAPLWAVLAAVAAWLLEIVVDNNFARSNWQTMLKMSWVVTLVLGLVNLSAFYLV